MRIPNCKRAFVDTRKLRDYSLNPDHPRGRYKAQVFAAALGLTADDTDALREKLLDVACDDEASMTETDVYGRRYQLDFDMAWHDKQARIRSAWIIRHDEDFPRLVSCYVM